MHNHKIQNVDQYQPEIIEKTICIFGQDGYETTYQKVDKIEENQKVKLVEYSCEDENDSSEMQNDEAEDAKMGERDDPNEINNTEGEGNDITIVNYNCKYRVLFKFSPSEIIMSCSSVYNQK